MLAWGLEQEDTAKPSTNAKIGTIVNFESRTNRLKATIFYWYMTT
jgi:hypothetical protein